MPVAGPARPLPWMLTVGEKKTGAGTDHALPGTSVGVGRNWEAMCRRVQREYEVLPRTGLHERRTPKGAIDVAARPLLHRLWLRSDDWPLWISAAAEPFLARLICLAYNHTVMTDMDGQTIVCVVCHRVLGKHVRSVSGCCGG